MPIASNRMADEEMRKRLFRAWWSYQAAVGGERSQEWLAEAVSNELGLKEPLTQSAVSRWMRGEGISLKKLVALAKVLGVDPGWLAFGEDSKAPPPADPMQEGMRRLLLPEKDG